MIYFFCKNNPSTDIIRLATYFPSLKIKLQMDFPTIMNYELRIMNYKGDHKGSPLRSNYNSTDVFPDNYEL